MSQCSQAPFPYIDVQAINDFCKEHVAPIVVCSRVAEYLALDQKLQLNRAVYICPLTAEQINQYVRESASEYADIAELLQTDQALTELAQTPLMLGILSAAYQNLAVGVTTRSVDARRHDVLAAYVATMYEHRSNVQRYTPKQTNDWLHWLACQLQEHKQAEFLIERIQPTWLANPGRQLLYHIATRFIGGLVMLIISIVAGLMGGLFLGSVASAFDSGIKIGIFLILAFLIGSVVGTRCRVVLSTGITVVLTALFVYFVPILDVSHQLSASLLVGVVFGIPGGLAGFSMASLETIYIFDKLTLAWYRIGRGVALSTAAALLLGLVNIFFTGRSFAYFLQFSLDVWVSLAPTLILVMGLGRSQVVDKTVYPNQGIWRSARNALIPAATAIGFSMLAGIVVSVVLQRPSRSNRLRSSSNRVIRLI